MKTKKKQNGFSLIEIILATLASSMVILIVATILLMAYWSWRTNNAFATLRRDSAFATHILAADIREASYDGLAYSSGQLTVQSAITNKTSTFTHTGDTLTYSTDSASALLIPEGLQTFGSVITADGVELTLELVNTNYAITITNQIFINTRN